MRILLVALVALGVSAQSAAAGTVTWRGYAEPAPGGTQVAYDAAPGEQNVLWMTRDAATVLIEDDGATIVAPTGPGQCIQTDPHVVRCPLLGTRLALTAHLGDGNDVADLHGGDQSVGVLDGGDGSDTLAIDTGQVSGDAGDDTITARLGDNNLLTGGPGTDVLRGGTGSDLIVGGPGGDALDGGGGSDSLYDNAPDAPSDDANDTLDGGPGNDGIYSRGGVDGVRGGEGDDRVFARDADSAPGSAAEALADAIDCGGGDDAVRADAVDAISGCEGVYVRCVEIGAPPWTDADARCPGDPEPVADPAPPADPAEPAAPAAVPALVARLRLDQSRIRLPLRRVPRALVSLNQTAALTITLARQKGKRRVALTGKVSRTLGAGTDRNISLSGLLGGRRHFTAGRYWITLSATAAGRTVTSRALLRFLPARRATRS